MQRILTDEVISTLAPLMDNAGEMPFDAVNRVLASELGNPKKYFSSFQVSPIASASLGQVHEATLLSGERVAVKVQREGLQASVQADLQTFRAINWALNKFYPSIDYAFLFPEFEVTIRRELDFRQEAKNSTRVKRMFKDAPIVFVPKVIRSTRKVLVMDFAEGFRISDLTSLKSHGIDPARVARALIWAFGT